MRAAAAGHEPRSAVSGGFKAGQEPRHAAGSGGGGGGATPRTAAGDFRLLVDASMSGGGGLRGEECGECEMSSVIRAPRRDEISRRVWRVRDERAYAVQSRETRGSCAPQYAEA